MRTRITVRGDDVELRGYLDGDMPVLGDFAKAMEPYGMVAASPADDDYNPFPVEDGPDMSIQAILMMIHGNDIDNLPDLIRHMANVHYMQAQVIQGERALKDSAEAELRDRELHHFETEQRLAAPVSDAEVQIAVAAYKAPRLHVNDTQNDREIDMRAALKAFLAARNG